LISKNEMVVKSNRLVEASYRLTLIEQRIILLAIAEARRTQRGINGEDFVRITAKNYAQQFGSDECNAYPQINEARKTLFNRQFTIYQIDEESGHQEVIEARWLSAASYIDGAGAIRLQFSQAIVPYITRLEANFTRYKLDKVANMSSAYAIRLYELLIQWGSVGRREVELEWLKKTLMVDQDYKALCDFKKRVLDVAVTQINAHSDLTTSYAQRKTGRNVTHLIFSFALKEDAQPEKAASKADEAPGSPLFQRLRGHGIGARLAAAWIRQDAARALSAAEYVEARAKAGQVKGSAAGYLRRVFESGGEIGPSAFEADVKAQAAQEAKAAKQAADQARRQAADAKRAEAERKEREQADREQAMARFEALPAGVQNALEAQFLAENQGVDASLFKKKGRGYIGFRLFVKKAMEQGGGQPRQPATKERGGHDMSWLDEPE